MLKDNPFIKGLSSVCTGEEGKEGRGEKQWAKGELSDLLKGTKSLQDQHGWAQHWMPALGLCAKTMPSLILRKMYVWHQEVFPSRQRRGQWWLQALAALRAQSLTKLSRTGLAEKPYFVVVESIERESFGRTGAFSVVETQAIPAAELTNYSKKVRVDKPRNIIQKEKRDSFQLWHHCTAGREEAELFHPSTGHQSPLGGLGGPDMAAKRLKESWGCSKVDRDSLSLAFPSAVVLASSRHTDRQTKVSASPGLLKVCTLWFQSWLLHSLAV